MQTRDVRNFKGVLWASSWRGRPNDVRLFLANVQSTLAWLMTPVRFGDTRFDFLASVFIKMQTIGCNQWLECQMNLNFKFVAGKKRCFVFCRFRLAAIHHFIGNVSSLKCPFKFPEKRVRLINRLSCQSLNPEGKEKSMTLRLMSFKDVFLSGKAKKKMNWQMFSRFGSHWQSLNPSNCCLITPSEILPW